MTKIILADDHPIFRIGAAKILAIGNDAWRVTQCSDTAQLYAAITTSRDAVVIVACTLRPDFSQVFGSARANSSEVLAIAENGEEPAQAVLSRLRGLIYRDASSMSLLECVRRVSCGERMIQPVQRTGDAEPIDFAGVRVRDCLAPREMQVAGLLLKGFSNREIGLRLGTSEQIVKNCFLRIYNKTGVSDRLELALFILHHRALAEAASAAGD